MALEGDVLRDPISNSRGSYQIEDAVSSEDTAWVDSCLVNDPEPSGSDSDAVKDALLDIVDSLTNSHFENLETENGSHPGRTSDELLPMIEDDEAGTASYPEEIYVDLVPPSEETRSAPFPIVTDDDFVLTSRMRVVLESYFSIPDDPNVTDDDSIPTSRKSETENFERYFQSSFLNPHDPSKSGDADVGLDSWVTSEIDASSDDIFKVWDLDTPSEEDELVKQLKAALAESSLLVTPSTPAGDTDLNVEALNDLIAGVADLSLHPSSG
ncbi:hypothetical protein NE237_024345 [Protea cynaroides]|uniref:Uncharacterized protein n=1 Tax=Protea cynaroides TaxID=273540 RepID=A0A9Q0HFP7_9MAGN|nr:hypothetical protein NE237_024345 [Protea cynaroides]